MQEFVTAINRLSQETKELKALLQNLFKLTRVRLLKDEWVDGKDLSASIHISPRTLRSLRDSGQLPFIQLSDKKYLYRFADIRALLKKLYLKKYPIKNK